MESLPLLNTRIIPPSLPCGVVSRPRLLDKLEKAADYRLSLISASAGFGKTTLLAEWISNCGLPAAWYTADESDNSFPRFVSYITAALQKKHPSLGISLRPALLSPQPPPVESIMTALINEIAMVDRDFILCIDDYHILEDPEITKAMAFLILNMPAPMHLVLISRKDPPFPLGKMRSRNHLLEIRTRDLRFQKEEAEYFLTDILTEDIGNHERETLEKKAEGWITGLQLAAISLNDRQSPSDFISGFSGKHKYVFDYMMQEVLDRQPPEIEQFLLKTSIFDRFCPALYDALSPKGAKGDSNEIIGLLLRSNLFIYEITEEKKWYRFHHLFRDFLQQRVKYRKLSTSPIHLKAARWFEDQGLLLEAFNHLIEAGDMDGTADFIFRHRDFTDQPGTYRLIFDWLDSLPESKWKCRPDLLVLHSSYRLSSGKVAGVMENLDLAESLCDKSSMKFLRGQIAVARATLALTKYDLKAVEKHSREALTLFPEKLFSFRAAPLWTLGMAAFYNRNLTQGQKLLENSAVLAEKGENHLISILSKISLGQLYENSNHLLRAEKYYMAAIELSGTPNLIVVCEAHLGLARIHYQKNELDAAARHGQLSLELVYQYDKNIDRFVFCELFLARLQRIGGNIGEAEKILTRLEQKVNLSGNEQRIRDIALEKIYLLIQKKQWADAEYLAGRHKLPQMAARIHLKRNHPEKALSAVRSAMSVTQSTMIPLEQLEFRLLEILSLYALGKTEQALEGFNEWMIPLGEVGFVRVFLDEGQPMKGLLQRATEYFEVPEYVHTLLDSFNRNEQRDSGGSEELSAGMSQPLIAPLTSRELEVLDLVAQGNSNREICEILHLALDTVKGHNRSIFQKLIVENRVQAINKARNLRILTTPCLK